MSDLQAAAEDFVYYHPTPILMSQTLIDDVRAAQEIMDELWLDAFVGPRYGPPAPLPLREVYTERHPSSGKIRPRLRKGNK